MRRPAACCSIALPEMAVAPVATQVVSGGAGRCRRSRYDGTAGGGESRQPSCGSRGSHMRSRWSCSRWSASSSRCSPSLPPEPVGTGAGSSDPLAVESHGPFTSIAVNADDACALTEAGDAICWSIGDSRVSTSVSGPFISIASGDGPTCAVTKAGEIQCWGPGGNRFTSMPTIHPETHRPACIRR